MLYKLKIWCWDVKFCNLYLSGRTPEASIRLLEGPHGRSKLAVWQVWRRPGAWFGVVILQELRPICHFYHDSAQSGSEAS